MTGRPQPIPSLYVHVPFCARKCDYCAFYSEAAVGSLADRYVDALVREMELVAPDLRLKTIFFGGGTPSILTLRQWKRVADAMERLGRENAAEWTVECNPATVSLEKARLLRASGVNRISLGVQSLDDALLDRLGRVHSRAMVFKSFEILRRAGFDNINLDLMFAIPGQTLATWRSTLTEALALGSEHLSSYEVTYEDDTPFYEQLRAGRFQVDEELACAMYEELVATATQHGYQQYEVSNFARRTSGHDTGTPGYACQHNINYWRGGAFYGLGPSAAGYVRGVRTKNWSNTRFYCEQLESGQRAVESHDPLPPLARAGEIAAFGLRMNAGWPFQLFQETTGFDLRRHWGSQIRELVARGWGHLGPADFRLTLRGLRFADAVAQDFLR